MTQNPNPIVIDSNTGEVLTAMRAITVQKSPEIPAAYRKGKAGQQLEILLNAIWRRNTPATAQLYLGINQFGTKYCYLNHVFYFFEAPELADHFLYLASQELHLRDIKKGVIDNLLTIMKTNQQIWIRDADTVTTPSIRVIDQGPNYIGYALQPGNIIPLIHPHGGHQALWQGVMTPATARWHEGSFHYDFFTPQTLAAVRENASHYLNNLLHVLMKMGICDKHQSLLLATLVHTLIAQKHLLIEITGENESHCSMVFKTIKTLIDPMVECSKTIPKRSEDIKREALQEYLITFESHNDNALKDEQQSAFIELLNGTAVVEAVPRAAYATKCRVKRPIMLKAPESIVDMPNLRKRTVSLHLPRTGSFFANAELANFTLDNARLELLRLTQVVSHVIYPSFCQPHSPYKVEVNAFDEMEDLIRIGCEISQLLHGSPAQFISDFTAWAIEDAFMQLDNNDGAYLVYLWAKDHTGTQPTQPLKDWLNELTYYADSEAIDLNDISPRKLGADLKQATTLLKKLGIHCESHGRSQRLSSWTITVEENIGLDSAIIVRPNMPCIQDFQTSTLPDARDIPTTFV